MNDLQLAYLHHHWSESSSTLSESPTAPSVTSTSPVSSTTSVASTLYVSQTLQTSKLPTLAYYNYGLSGLGVGIFCAPAVCPIEVVKVRMQLDRRESTGIQPPSISILPPFSLHSTSILPPFYLPASPIKKEMHISKEYLNNNNCYLAGSKDSVTSLRYTGPWDCFKKILKTEGVWGLYL